MTGSFLVFVCRAGLLLAGLLLAGPLQAQDSTLTRLLGQHRYALTPDGRTFTGPGWSKLEQAVRQSRFVLLGEDHGTVEIPLFTAALAQVFKPAVFAVEIDAYETQDLTRLVAQDGPPTAFSQRYPMSLSFYSRAEEFEMGRTLSRQQVRLVGLDQVNCFYAGRFYARLARLVASPAARTYLQQRAAAYQAHDRAVMGPKPDQTTMFHQSRGTLDSLLALTRLESPAAQQMARDYVASATIYQHALDASAGLLGHEERVAYLKKQLLREFGGQVSSGKPLPKTLFKFGALHVARGGSLLEGVYDLGNLALSLAQVQGQRSLHILIAGRQGTRNVGFYPGNVPQNVQTYSNAEEDIVKPFFALSSSSTWQVFDLRPLREALLHEKLQLASQQLHTILLGYDYVVIIPETTAARNY